MNYHFVKKFLNDACEYIKGVKGPDGMQPILKSKRKTGFLGFLLCVKAVHGLAEDLVSGENSVLKYILKYKMSQDHFELFFGAVRASGGWNNNPTVQVCVQATVDETQHHRRTRKLRSSRRHGHAEQC